MDDFASNLERLRAQWGQPAPVAAPPRAPVAPASPPAAARPRLTPIAAPAATPAPAAGRARLTPIDPPNLRPRIGTSGIANPLEMSPAERARENTRLLRENEAQEPILRAGLDTARSQRDALSTLFSDPEAMQRTLRNLSLGVTPLDLPSDLIDLLSGDTVNMARRDPGALERAMDDVANGRIPTVVQERMDEASDRMARDALKLLENYSTRASLRTAVETGEGGATRTGVGLAVDGIFRGLGSIPIGVIRASGQLGDLVQQTISGNVTENHVVQASNYLRSVLEAAFPRNEFQAENFFGQLGEGFGSMTGFIFAGMAAKAIGSAAGLGAGAARTGGTLVTGGASQASSQLDLAGDADIAGRWFAFLAGFGLGATEVVPIDRILGRAEAMTGGAISRAFRGGFSGAGEEGLQELFQGMGATGVQALIDQTDAPIDWSSNWGQMLVGAVVGGKMGAVTAVVGGRRVPVSSLAGAPAGTVTPPAPAAGSPAPPPPPASPGAAAAPAPPIPGVPPDAAPADVLYPPPAAPLGTPDPTLPPKPGLPPAGVSPEDHALLIADGFAADEIADMDPSEVAYNVQDAIDKGVVPGPVTPAVPPTTGVPVVPPVSAPSPAPAAPLVPGAPTPAPVIAPAAPLAPAPVAVPPAAAAPMPAVAPVAPPQGHAGTVGQPGAEPVIVPPVGGAVQLPAPVAGAAVPNEAWLRANISGSYAGLTPSGGFATEITTTDRRTFHQIDRGAPWLPGRLPQEHYTRPRLTPIPAPRLKAAVQKALDRRFRGYDPATGKIYDDVWGKKVSSAVDDVGLSPAELEALEKRGLAYSEEFFDGPIKKRGFKMTGEQFERLRAESGKPAPDEAAVKKAPPTASADERATEPLPKGVRTRGKKVRRPSDHLIDFLIDKGGLKSDPQYGENIRRAFRPGRGALVGPNGKWSPDDARSLVAQAHYWPMSDAEADRTTVADFIDLLNEALLPGAEVVPHTADAQARQAESRSNRDEERRVEEIEAAILAAMKADGIEADKALFKKAVEVATAAGYGPEMTDEEVAGSLDRGAAILAEEDVKEVVADEIPYFDTNEPLTSEIPEWADTAAGDPDSDAAPDSGEGGGVGGQQDSGEVPGAGEREGEAGGDSKAPAVARFTTAKGSTYVVHADGTTTRDKKFRPEHGEKEQGPQPRSEVTFYVTEAQADALSLFQTYGGPPMAIEAFGNGGKWGVRYTETGVGGFVGRKKGAFEPRTIIEPKTSPEVGLLPVEVWKNGARVHFGNKITTLEPAIDKTPIGDQYVLPGAEKISDAKLAQMKADKPLQAKADQRPADEGLFGDGMKQVDHVDEARKPAAPKEKAAAPAPAAVEPVKVAPAKPAKSSARIEDAGEKIGGARKDRWRERGLTLDDLSGMTPTEEFEHVKKENVWKAPDYQALIAGGVAPEAAAAIKLMRDRLAAKPKTDSAEERRRYVTMVTIIRDETMKAKALNDLRGLQDNVLKHLGWNAEDKKGWQSTETRATLFSAFTGRTAKFDVVGGRDLLRIAEMLREGWPAPTKREKTEDDGKGKIPARPHLDNIKRTGKEVRGGRDVGSEDFIKDFGFRAVEFGNWVASDERQKVVNIAFEALHDLADVVGIPARAISLGDSLALAFGARGSGKAAAHYEPGRMVINMTKLSGAGSLAHEWAHALDHYYGTLNKDVGTRGTPEGASGWYARGDYSGKPRTKISRATGVRTEEVRLSNLRPEMAVAFDRVMAAMFEKNKTKAEAVRNQELSIESAKARIATQEKRVAESTQPVISKFKRDSRDYIKQTQAMVAVGEARLGELRNNPADQDPSYGREATSYAKEAQHLSGKSAAGYWTRPTEMFARAFESFVQDKIMLAENVSEYLVHGTSGGVYTRERGFKGDPYPAGPERTAINEAFDNLVQTIETKVDPSGTVTLASAMPISPAPVFYSALLRAVEAAATVRATTAQWLGTLRNAPGVKAEEMNWLGVEVWLNEQPGIVTKEALAAFIRANQVQVKEVVKGEKQRIELKWIEREDGSVVDESGIFVLQETRNGWSLTNTKRDITLDFVTRSAAEDSIQFTGEYEGGPTKFESYQLPGGENYRELLLTLPVKTSPKAAEAFALTKQMQDGDFNSLSYPERQAMFARRDALLREAREEEGGAGGYRSSHWEEPNVLAHVRFSERTVGDRRVLHIEELQSDWLQAGRKRGYQAPEAEDRLRLKKLEGEWDDLGDRILLRDLGALEPDIAASEAAKARRIDIAAEMNAINERLRANALAVPDAPFKTTWPELAFKRMIRWAAENGFDEIAWTPGKIQADRYSLSKQVSRLAYTEGPGPVKYIKAWDHDGKEVIKKPITNPEEELPDLVGKAVADKLLAVEPVKTPLLPEVRAGDLIVHEGALSREFVTLGGRRLEVGKGTVADEAGAREYAANYFNAHAAEINKKRTAQGESTRELSGLDLEVGGEGMVAFYDKMLVATANKLGKKWGAKVGTTSVRTRQPRKEIAVEEPEDFEYASLEAQARWRAENEAALREAFVSRGKVDTTDVDLHSLLITPEMRAAVMKGQPLFQKDAAGRTGAEASPRSPAEVHRLMNDIHAASGRLLGRRFKNLSFRQTMTIGEVNREKAEAHLKALIGGDPNSPLFGLYTHIADDASLSSIIIALQSANDPLRVFMHEAWHHIEQALLNGDELAILRRHMPSIRKMAAKAYPHLTEAQLNEMPAYELTAMAFEGYWQAMEQGGSLAGYHIAIRRVFEMLRKFFDELRRILNRRGVMEVRDLFGGALAGKFSERTAVSNFEAQIASAQETTPLAFASTPASWAAGGWNKRPSWLKVDNPGGAWLATKQANAEEDMRTTRALSNTGRGLMGPTTGYHADEFMLDASLINLPGVMGEMPGPGGRKYDELLKEVQEGSGKIESPILIGVNHKGQAFVIEGNNRIAVAKKLGLKVPTEVRWYNGGEQASTGFTPAVVDEIVRASAQPEAPQTETPAFKRWFGDSKVVDEAGEPLVVYHGTTADTRGVFHMPSFFTEHQGEASAYTFWKDLQRREKQSKPKYLPVSGTGVGVGPGRYPYVGIISDIPYSERGKVWATDQGIVRVLEDGRVEVFTDLEYRVGTSDATTIKVVRGDGKTAFQRLARYRRELLDERLPPGTGEGGNVSSVYLDIRNPKEMSPLEANRFGARLGGTQEEWRAAVAKLEAEGYDGIVTYSDEGAAFNMAGETVPKQWLPFRPNQIKSATGNRGTFDPANASILGSAVAGLGPFDSAGAAERQKLMGRRFSLRQPIDRVLRIPFDIFGGLNNKGEWKPGLYLFKGASNVITSAKFSENGRFRFLNPVLHRARAGLIDRYGLDPAYVERERQRGLDERSILMDVPEIMETLKSADIGATEAKVLHDIMTGEPVADEAIARLAQPIRNSIDQLGQEAVNLGLLSAESFERNRGSYLHRVYQKHENDQNGLTRLVNKLNASSRRRIIGNQFKGRGMWQEVSAVSLARGPIETLPTKGEKFRMLDLMATDGQEALPGIEASKPRAAKRVYIPDGPIPERYSEYTDRGVWEVRGIKGKNVILWRDYTKAERVKMGEITDARYTITKTYMVMAHDLATGRFYRDIAMNRDWTMLTEPPDGTWKDAGEYRRFWEDQAIQWVKVPDTIIPKSKTRRYGALAGKYVRAEIWRDLHELELMQRSTWWNTLLTIWKKNMTARHPVVHMNNVMSNLVLMDLADIGSRDLAQAIVAMVSKGDVYEEARLAGAFGADMVAQEFRDNILKPILDGIQKEMQGGADTMEARLGLVGKLADGIWKGAWKIDKGMLRLYQLEDEVFRMALYIRRRAQGVEPAEAGLEARDQFLNYDIRAPWVNAARRSVLPFISYTYRAVPMIAKAAMTHPWKLAKYVAIAYGVNALAYSLLDDDDEDEQRRSMRTEEQGRTWFGAPRMIRMPWNDSHDFPVFLDIRRWIPAGDVFDLNQGHGAFHVPAWLQFGGPLMLGMELAFNKRMFTEQPITNALTDDFWDSANKIADWAWKAWMPGAAWIPGSWYWTRIGNSLTGARDWMGRPYDPLTAIASSFGVKLKPQDVQEGFASHAFEFDDIEQALRQEANILGRDLQRGLISQATFDARMQRIVEKAQRLDRNRRETFGTR